MPKSLFLSLFFLLIFSGWCADTVQAAPAQGNEIREYTCPILAQAPELDGAVAGDPAWEGVPVATGYRNLRTGLASAKQTSFRMGYTPAGLYFGVICQEPAPDTLRADAPDGDIRELAHEDSLMVFLAPDTETMHAFVVNAIGSRASTRTLKKWQAQTQLGAGHWAAEIVLPWEVVGAFPAEGAAWGLNVLRHVRSEHLRERSTWADLAYRDDEVENLGTLRFQAIAADQRAAIEARMTREAIQEEGLLFSRPHTGILLQSEFNEEQVLYNQGIHVAPRLSPDGRRILFNSVEGGAPGVWVANRRGKQKERICDGGQAAWSPDGTRIVFERAGRIVDRDLKSGEERVVSPDGAPALAYPSYLPEGYPGGARYLCAGAAGENVYALSGDTAGEPVLLAEAKIRSAPRCSPDGTMVVFQNGAHLYLLDLATQTTRFLTAAPGVQTSPVWAGDGQSVCFAQATSPLAPWWDLCLVRLEEPPVVHLIERRIHPGFDWLGSTLESARTMRIPGASFAVRHGDKPFDARSSSEAVAWEDWPLLPEGTTGPLEGTVVVENDWLRLCISRGGVFVLPKRSRLPQPLVLCVAGADGKQASTVSGIALDHCDGDGCALRVVFGAGGEGPVTGTLRVPRGRPIVELQLGEEAGRVGVQADIALVAVPDRLANDFVLDPSTMREGMVAPLPDSPVALGCLAGSEAMVLLATRAEAPAFEMTPVEGATRLTAQPEAQGRVVLGLLDAATMWQRPELVSGAGGRGAGVDWTPPLHAAWRMAVWGEDAGYARAWSVDDLGDLGGDALPVERSFRSRPDGALLYVWNRDVMTPPEVLTPEDLLWDVWGVEGGLRELDIEGVLGYRSAEEPVLFRELCRHRMDWNPAQAASEYHNFGILEVMGSVFAVNSDGVRSLVTHLGNDALGILRGLDTRIGEYEQFLKEVLSFCQSEEGAGRQGLLAALAAEATGMLEQSLQRPRTEVGQAADALDAILAIVGTRDGLTLSFFESFCKMPGNDKWAGIYEDFLGYTAAREGRVWYEDTIRYELWYEDDFQSFAKHCRRILRERQDILEQYRQWTQTMCGRAARVAVTQPQFKEVAGELERRAHAVLRNRYYLEGDWRGETPLPTGVLP